MASIVEEMGVDVEGDRDARESEEAADLCDVKLRSTMKWLAKVCRRS